MVTTPQGGQEDGRRLEAPVTALRDPKILESELYAQMFNVDKGHSNRWWRISPPKGEVNYHTVTIDTNRLDEEDYLELIVLPRLKAIGFKVRR